MNAILPTRLRLVVIGNGMAGMRTVEEILARTPQKYSITVFGAEPHPNYNRIMLSPVLAREKTFEEIVINEHAWYATNGIELIAGERVWHVDRTERVVHGEKGTTRPYDVMLLATGSNPFILPLVGRDLPGVIGFRDIGDVHTMLAAAERGGNAVVIGGGLLGLEAANGLAQAGMHVTVLHLNPTLMDRQLDPTAGAMLRADLERRGIHVITEAHTAAIRGTEAGVEAVELKDGTVLPAHLVVMAVGIKPNVQLGQEIGLETKRGIVVDDQMRTSDPAVFAVGECVEHRGQTYGLVAPLWDMSKICADAISGTADTAYEGSVTGTRLKVTGIDMYSAGDFTPGHDTDDVIFRDPARGVYRRLVLRDDKLVGAVLYGDAGDGGWYFSLIRTGAALGPLRDTVIFGQSVAEAATGAEPATAATMADTAEICGCNGVCKGTVVETIRAKGLTTLSDVRAHTKASSSCGSCTKLVEQLLEAAAGDAYAPAEGEPAMCRCTGHGHDHVRAEIVARGLKTIPATMDALGWTTADGCHVCRPALNYYLLCAWPGEYEDQAQSRFVNERMHANIQKDGTYSVIPRMWGGLTSARELRAIADVVDKFAIPTVKVTGGQRIDLLGVKREDLPAVWRDLGAAGMVSGHGYGKALRTVKTCVGSEWCRFGTQDSTAMGVAIERMSWGSWHPHKVKIAVSGCPRNCAEATCKDFGVVAVESGWELSVGGNAGIHLRATDPLCKVATPAEVLEYCAAFLQLYREDARYLERTAPWVERRGIEWVRARVVADAANRRALNGRFLYAQRFSQTDPWAERANGPVPAPYATLVAAA